MHRRLIAGVALACALVAGLTTAPAQAAYRSHYTAHLSRVFYIAMENQSFDGVIGKDDAAGRPDTPVITYLALHYGLETMAFGTTHPSLPNYLSGIAGNYYGIQDDNPSCFAKPKQNPCDNQAANGTNIVDELEAAGMTWVAFEQSMPSAGYLGPQYPTGPSAPTHYAQKHNPFVYFKDIATNPKRLKNIRPLNTMSDLSSVLANPATAPNYVYIVPDQCHDMHGTSDCSKPDALLRQSDAYVGQLVQTITHSKAYTSDSAIVISWDEDDYSSNLGCCLSFGPHGGGHTVTIVITPRYHQAIETAIPSNHYNELRTIEDAFNLPQLGQSAYVEASLFPLIP